LKLDSIKQKQFITSFKQDYRVLTYLVNIEDLFNEEYIYFKIISSNRTSYENDLITNKFLKNKIILFDTIYDGEIYYLYKKYRCDNYFFIINTC
jgi:hypothetical protein